MTLSSGEAEHITTNATATLLGAGITRVDFFDANQRIGVGTLSFADQSVPEPTLLLRAVASSVFVTACTDICGFFSFLGLLSVGLRYFA
jgi:hypothetical protein